VNTLHSGCSREIEIQDLGTHPPIGSWVWGGQGIAYRVTDRYRQDRKFWLTLTTDSGPIEMPLERVAGWAESSPTELDIEAGKFASLFPGVVVEVNTQPSIPEPPVPKPPTSTPEPFAVGDRVTSLSELDPPNTTGIVAEVGELAGKVYLTVEQDDGTLSMAQAGWWTASPLLPLPFQLGDHVRYLGEGWLGSQMRPLLSGKTLVVKSIQHTPTGGIWVTCHVPGGLDQTIPASDLKHFY
jgi:hypothetical protein